MSVSSCPRCAQQVTLPVGVSNSARVRCPLCNAHYTLADALVNMPPLLEVLDNGQADGGLDWLDEAESDSTAPATSIGIADDAELNLNDALDLDVEPKLAAAVESEEELRFDAIEMEHDDSDSQDQDTEVEELPFTTSDALVRHAPADDEPLEVSAADDADILDFGSEVAKNEPASLADELDSDELGSFDEEASSEEEISFNFQEEGTATTPGDDEVSFDFEEVADAADSQPKIDELGLPVRAVAADEDPIELDFAEADADPAATIDFSEEPETKGKKKKKVKAPKPAKVKAPKEPGERSLVGTLLSLVLAGLIAIPLALYGALWISPDYDFIGMRKWLPSAMLPAGKPPRTLAQAPPALPPSPPADASTEAPVEPSAEDPAAGQPSTEDATATPQPAEPVRAIDAPASSEPQPPASTEPAPAEPVPAEPLPIEPPAADPAAATPPAEAPSAEPAEAPAPAEEMPVEPKAEEPAEPIADPFAEPSEPATPAAEEPKVEASEPKEEMPADSDAAPASDDPADPFAEPAPAEPAPADASAADEAAAAPAEPEEPLGPRNAQKFSPEDVVKAAQDFGAADQRMAAALASMDKNDVKKARANFFLSLYHFADVLAAVNREPFDKQPADFQQGMRQLAGDSARLKELGAFAAKWLGFGKRTTPGIVLAGTVESAEQVGKLYHITVKLTDDAPSVEIVSHNDPGVIAGDQVIVLGTIVQQPVEQLAGYEGSAPVVVWSGVTFNTAAEK